MSHVRAETFAIVGAAPEIVYEILADYRTHHPHILPPAFFRAMEVEAGGHGAGTVLRVEMSVFGNDRSFYLKVSEPEPGRVLAETDCDTGMTTSFVVDPVGNDQQARVTIATEWDALPGIRGVLDRLVTPLVMRRIYREQLRLLDDYARARQREET